MPDVLLIQPPIQDFYLTRKRTQPYGLASIAASLEAAGFTVEILDALANRRQRAISTPLEMEYLEPFYGKPDRSPFALFHQYHHYGYAMEYIGRRAGASKAPLVGISALFTPYADMALQTAIVVKKHHPHSTIVVGGHHPTALPEAVMNCNAVDFVVRGEGEIAMTKLARWRLQGGRLGDVPGLVQRKKNGALHIRSAAVVPDLSALPPPAIHLLNHRHYRRGKSAGLVVTASRGCPMSCTYCCMGAGSAIPYRRRSVASVVREITHAVTQGDAAFVDLEDENLTLDQRWSMRLFQTLAMRFPEHKLELRAMNGLYPATLTAELVTAMRRAGFRTLNLSLGATQPHQLARFGRPDLRPAFDHALNLAAQNDMDVVGYVIAAAPYQCASDSLQDLLWLACRRVLVGISVYYPAPGSIDYGTCQTRGQLPLHFCQMRSSALPLNHPTTRLETVTLLRLTRILNFMKGLHDRGEVIPTPQACSTKHLAPNLDRHALGRKLLSWFLKDGIIRGVTPEGTLYPHHACKELIRGFRHGLGESTLRGTQV